MTRRTIGFLVTIALGLLVVPLATEAQPPAKGRAPGGALTKARYVGYAL